MYSVLPSYALGCHGCDAAVAESVFVGQAHLKISTNDYDWLGAGIYFWENSPARALAYFNELQANPLPPARKSKPPPWWAL